MSTNLISGLSSGFDWQSVVTQLIDIEHQRVDTISSKKTQDEKKLTEWQSFNTKLLSLKTAAGNLKDAADFALYKTTLTTDNSTIEASKLLLATTSAAASSGSYSIRIDNLAAAQKISSGSFVSTSTALGEDFAGDILINGKVITLAATDTLVNVRDKINNVGAGVTAGFINYDGNDNRLVLSSDNTGAAGIDLLNGGATDILNRLGLTDTARTAKNHIAGGDRTDLFTSTNVSIKSLLGLTSTQTSADNEIVINGHAVEAIDLSTDTLADLQSKFAAAGLSATITSETEDGQTLYRLMVAGSDNTYSDKNNILETLGIIRGGVSDVSGVTGDIANTAGGVPIASTTLLKDIDGYTDYQGTDYLRMEGIDTNGNAVSDETLTISDTTTVADLLAGIETVFGNVTASITGTGKLMIMDNTPGASSLSFKIGVKNLGGAADDSLKFDSDGDLGSASAIRQRQLLAGADAAITVDGVTVSRSQNTIIDIIPGVTLDLLQAEQDTTVTLTIGRDIDTIVKNINTFVSSYNAVSSYLRTQTSYDETNKAAGGLLFADGTLASVKSDITSILVQSVWGVSADFSTLGLAGISVDKVGQLSVDSTKLRGYLTSNFNDIQKLFAATGTTDTGTLSYISHGINTNEGEYNVHIDTAATRSTSLPSDNISLSGDETLTITASGSSAVIDLTAGMSMEQIVTAINSELAMSHTQILVGASQLYADAGQTATISAATKWNSVYDNTGVSANLVDGDVISFTGTLRNGTAITGSYTIANTATDSVQGLLSAVETAFGNQVAAAIDASGRITVTDKTTGKSNVSLTLDTTQAHYLYFGTLLTSNDGGQTGRYPIGIAASLDVGNHLILNHTSYGSENSLTISQLNNLLWTGGDQTVDNGVDVAGTINGESATGTGQLLKGDSGSAGVEGLSILYNGTAGGIDAGSIKLTFGVAELYDRTLFSITDSLTGYVANKQQSIQDEIKRYQTQIDKMEAQLDRKQETLLNRFVQMELALQKIQSQSSWLTGQIEAAKNGWYKE